MKTLIAITLLAGAAFFHSASAAEPTSKTAQTHPSATVGGQVRRPGPVEITKASTLYDVLQIAGGLNEFGAERRIKIYRNSKLQGTYNLKDDAQKMTKILPSDTIEVVPKNLLGR